MSLDPVSEVLALAKQQLVDAPVDAASRMVRFCELLLAWNIRLNLTGAKKMEDLLGEHLPDSFGAARLLPPASTVIDVGSGGGLPSIPLAILRPDCRFTLAEPRAKRVAFLRAAVRECGCEDVSIVRQRHDTVESKFAVALSRATFPPQEWLDVSRGLVSPGGRVLVFATDSIGADGAHLLESLRYSTRGGARRWLGMFCFT